MGNYSEAHICQCLTRLATLRRDNVVTISGNRQKTGNQFTEGVFSLARALLQLGLSTGDIVAISAFNRFSLSKFLFLLFLLLKKDEQPYKPTLSQLIRLHVLFKQVDSLND